MFTKKLKPFLSLKKICHLKFLYTYEYILIIIVWITIDLKFVKF